MSPSFCWQPYCFLWTGFVFWNGIGLNLAQGYEIYGNEIDRTPLSPLAQEPPPSPIFPRQPEQPVISPPSSGEQESFPEIFPEINLPPSLPDSELEDSETFSEETIVVQRFEFEGSTLFSREQLEAVTQPYLNRPLSFTELVEVEAKVTA